MAPDDVHSLHVTVSTYQLNSWGEYMKQLVPAALDMAISEDAHFREGLPVNFLEYMGVMHSERDDQRRAAFQTHVRRLFTTMVSIASNKEGG